MSARDAFRFINDLDDATLRALIGRLEFRGQDPTFGRLRDAYFARLPLAGAREVLDLGCGTGVVGRALARRDDFAGRVVGVDRVRRWSRQPAASPPPTAWRGGLSSGPAMCTPSTSRRIGSTASSPTP